MACYEDLRQALAATAKERDEAVKRLREWEKSGRITEDAPSGTDSKTRNRLEVDEP